MSRWGRFFWDILLCLVGDVSFETFSWKVEGGIVLSSIVYHILFLIFSLYILLRTIGYALYEINTIQNKVGGISVIVFSVLVVIFSNVIVWMYWFLLC